MIAMILVFCLMHAYLKCFKSPEKKFRLVNQIAKFTPPVLPKARDSYELTKKRKSKMYLKIS